MATSKSSMGNFDFNEIKKQMKELKEATEKAKNEYEEKEAKGEISKQPLGQKVLGILILVVLLIIVGFVIISNLDTLFLPKNSITIKVTDENGDSIEGISINVSSKDGIYNENYNDFSNTTILGAKSGDYILTFTSIPEGYTCQELVDNFTLNQDGKIKLEYECTKNN